MNIFFRSNSLETVNTLFYRMTHHLGLDVFFDVLIGYKIVIGIMLLGYLIHWIPERFKIQYRNWFAKQPLPVMGTIIILAVFVMYQLMSGEMQPFIYFQF